MRSIRAKRILRNVVGEPPGDREEHPFIRRKVWRAALIFQGVQVDEEHRGLGLLVLRPGDGGSELIQELVRQAGQAIPDGVMEKALLRALLGVLYVL